MRDEISIGDLEVSPNYFLAGFKLMSNMKVLQLEVQGADTIIDDEFKARLKKVLRATTVVTFNGNRYDMPIIHKVLCTEVITPRDIFEMSKEMIAEGYPPYKIYQVFDIRRYEMVDHVDLIEPQPAVFASLKKLGARMHSKKLQDLPYAYDKHLTEQEMGVMKVYNVNDLDTTIDLYNEIEHEILLRVEMGVTYGMDLRSKSGAQVAEAVLLRMTNYKGKTPPVPKTVKYVPPDCIVFKTERINELFTKYKKHTFLVNQKNGQPIVPDWLKTIKKIDYGAVTFGNTKYQMGVGGLHDKMKQTVRHTEDGYSLIDIDVKSFYPSLLIEFGYFPDHIGKKFLEVYRAFYERRNNPDTGIKMLMQREKDPDKKKALKDESNSIKLILNSAFGKLGSMFSKLYAPDMMMQITVTGQLMLLMLVESLEENGIEVFYGNTDGITTMVHDDDIPLMRALILEWELDTGMFMEETHFSDCYIRDVNAFVNITTDGELKRKGAYAEPDLSKDSEYTIVFDAIAEYLLTGKPMEETIRECTDVRQFLTARAVKYGGYWNVGDVDTTDEFDLASKAKDENKKKIPVPADVISRNYDYAKMQLGDKMFLGKTVRWYYSSGGTNIQYLSPKTSNMAKVAKSDNCIPMMNIPEGNTIPDTISYKIYDELCIKHLNELGVHYG